MAPWTMPSAKGGKKMSVRDAVDAYEKELTKVATLLPRAAPGGPRLRAPYTVSEAASLDEIEKRRAAKASSVRIVFSFVRCDHACAQGMWVNVESFPKRG